MKSEEKLEIRAHVKARVSLHMSTKEIFPELCNIHGSTMVMLRTVFRWVKKFQGVSVVLRTVTIKAGQLLQQRRKKLMPLGV